LVLLSSLFLVTLRWIEPNEAGEFISESWKLAVLLLCLRPVAFFSGDMIMALSFCTSFTLGDNGQGREISDGA